MLTEKSTVTASSFANAHLALSWVQGLNSKKEMAIAMQTSHVAIMGCSVENWITTKTTPLSIKLISSIQAKL
ncbi:hypothetical protein FEM48_Zijuj05G0183800 [Ziziphus jujuba var. spinosa]|uniref:Uncharacterized protein n=1 Tax=Ziziphus jujuba var. spinosa TaxID=714518 RepID=A0A978VGE7_ZIZJJ|nr:hypothetical protein FEM48_Zijuj05G0183800 [Ziziphus jujuba var. spinosa]